jgi:hypothetical protein
MKNFLQIQAELSAASVAAFERLNAAHADFALSCKPASAGGCPENFWAASAKVKKTVSAYALAVMASRAHARTA